MLGRRLSSMCRNSSNERIAKVRVESTLQKVEQLFANPITYLDEEHYKLAIDQAHKSLLQIEKPATNCISEELKLKYFALKEIIEGNKHKPVYLENILDSKMLHKFDQKSLLTHIAKVVVSSYEKSSSAEDILQEIFSPFTHNGSHSTSLII